MSAFFELNMTLRERICHKGFEVALQKSRQSTIELQEEEIKSLKRRVAELEVYQDRCVRARRMIRVAFPQVREELRKVVVLNHWRDTSWPLDFVETWNGLPKVSRIITNYAGEEETEEQTEDENNEEWTINE